MSCLRTSGTARPSSAAEGRLTRSFDRDQHDDDDGPARHEPASDLDAARHRIRTSSSTRSGARRSTASSASSPLPASPDGLEALSRRDHVLGDTAEHRLVVHGETRTARAGRATARGMCGLRPPAPTRSAVASSSPRSHEHSIAVASQRLDGVGRSLVTHHAPRAQPGSRRHARAAMPSPSAIPNPRARPWNRATRSSVFSGPSVSPRPDDGGGLV
jgi:hypothetical protein